MRIVVASGYFDPLHPGHLDYLEAAKLLGDKLVVIVNNDHQAQLKKGKSFMKLEDRMRLLTRYEFIDFVVRSVDTEPSVLHTLKQIVGFFRLNNDDVVFANGGDWKENCPEERINPNGSCVHHYCDFVYNVGGKKTQSSSELLERWIKLADANIVKRLLDLEIIDWRTEMLKYKEDKNERSNNETEQI